MLLAHGLSHRAALECGLSAVAAKRAAVDCGRGLRLFGCGGTLPRLSPPLWRHAQGVSGEISLANDRFIRCGAWQTAVQRTKTAPTRWVPFFYPPKRPRASVISSIVLKFKIAVNADSARQIGIYKAFPPDTLITCPVIILACLLARNKTVSAISSG